MPAITLGLAQVDERLQALRRRLNGLTAQHSVYLGASALILAVTVLIILALRASATTFRIALWTGTLLSAGVVAACIVVPRRRWLDVHATAYLADRRGQLTDRLSTLIDLRERPRPSRLAPLLVAQTLALGARWQPARIVPRRVPRSIYVLLAALLALASTAFVERRPPPPATPAHAGGVTAALSASASQRAPGAGITGADAAQTTGGAPQEAPDEGTTGKVPGDATLHEGRSSDASSDAPASSLRARPGNADATRQPDGPLAALPDRLQKAIRRAFHAEAMGEPQQLARAESNGAKSGERSDQDRDGGGAQRHGAPGEGKTDTRAPDTQASQPGAEAQAQKPTDPSKPGERQAGQRQGGTDEQGFKGASPAAGQGSSPGGLMDAKATGPAIGHGAAKTFKLTITSFLRAVERKGNQPRRHGKRISTTGAAGVGGGSEATLNERQLNDDVLRKAEIPPEYEDIVRRVYSLRDRQ